MRELRHLASGTLFLFLFAFSSSNASAQSPLSPAPPPPPPTTNSTPSGDSADMGHGGSSYEDYIPTRKETYALAVKVLAEAARDTKHPDIRIQNLAALSELGADPRALKVMLTGLSDPDAHVRTAAALAAGQGRVSALAPDLNKLLRDADSQVVLAAALALQQLGDSAGQTITEAASESAKAELTLSPFGFGSIAQQFLQRRGGDPSHAAPVEALDQSRAAANKLQLLADLKSKDIVVKATAERLLSDFQGLEVPDALGKLLNDKDAPVRLTAAASLIRSTDAMHAGAPPTGPKHP